MKVQVKRAFKSYFFVIKKAVKKQTSSAWIFLQPAIQVCRGAYISYFKINAPIFCCPLFLEEYLNPQVRINKMVNEHTADYHSNPSELTSRIHPWKYICESKNWIFTHAPKQNFPPGSYHNHSSRGKFPISSKNLYPKRVGGGLWSWQNDQN